MQTSKMRVAGTKWIKLRSAYEEHLIDVRKNKRVRALVVLSGARALGERTVAVRAQGTGNRNSIFGRRRLAENRTITCLMRGEKHVWHDQSASSSSFWQIY